MDFFDVIVIGAGHAGCEAAVAAAKLKCKTLVLAANLDAVAFLACNPSIGGTAKGQIVKEIDALGGQMALIADKCTLQMRMLNKSKGAAVYSPRAQVDKNAYHTEFKKLLESTEGLRLRQGEAVGIKKITKKSQTLWEVSTAAGEKFRCVSLIVATGVYLSSRIIVGKYTKKQGPNGFAGCYRLSAELKKLGFTVVKPSGTFYIFPKALEEDANAFCKKAMKYDLALVPGDSFGCPGYFRMAYCIDTEKVRRSFAALEKFVAEEYGK